MIINHNYHKSLNNNSPNSSRNNKLPNSSSNNNHPNNNNNNSHSNNNKLLKKMLKKANDKNDLFKLVNETFMFIYAKR